MKLERPGERLPPLTNKSDRSSPARTVLSFDPYSFAGLRFPPPRAQTDPRASASARARILEILDFA